MVFGSSSKNKSGTKLSRADKKKEKKNSEGGHFPTTLRNAPSGQRTSGVLFGPRNPRPDASTSAPPEWTIPNPANQITWQPLDHRPPTAELSTAQLIFNLHGTVQDQREELDRLVSFKGENERLKGEVTQLQLTSSTLDQEAKDARSLQQGLQRQVKDLKEELRKEREELQKERDRMGKIIRSLNNDVQVLNQELRNERVRTGPLNVQITSLQSQVHSLQGQIASMKRHEQKQQNELTSLKQCKKSLEYDLETSRNNESNLADQIKMNEGAFADLEKELDDARRVYAAQAEDVRKAQESAFKLLDQEQWVPESDSEVSRKLNSVQASITSWCKTYALKATMDFGSLSPNNLLCVQHILKDISQYKDGVSLVNLKDAAIGAKWPNILLSAALAHAIYKTIFNNPFFFEDGFQSPDTQDIKQDTVATPAIQRVYIDLLKADKEGANAWRAQTLRLLDPQTSMGQTSNKGNKQLKEATHGLRISAAKRFSQTFLKGHARVFLDPASDLVDRRQQQLEEISARATDISFKLWTQKTQLRSLAVDDLPQKKGVVRFSSSSDLLEHHNLHLLQLDDDETCLDGSRVVLVTHPAVVAYGNAEGSDYGTQRIWKKAVVWMGNNPVMG